MIRANWLAAMLVGSAASAFGQGIPLAASRPGDLPVARDSQPTPGSKRGRSISLGVTGSVSPPPSIGTPYGPVPASRVAVYYYPPPVVVMPADVVFIPAPRRSIEHERALVDFYLPFLREPGGQLADLPGVMQGAPASVFRPVRPDERAMAPLAGPNLFQPPLRPEPRPMGNPGDANRRPARRELPPLPGPQPPGKDSKVEAARLLVLGQDAFAQREYLRAERRFHEAIQEARREKQAYFLLAQAQFALGKYQEAVGSIHAGMQLDPFWPESAFQPRPLYRGAQREFEEQLQRLAIAVKRYPADPVLLFLYAYQLWFDDRRDEAAVIFERARTSSSDARFVQRFLQPWPLAPLW